MNKKLLFLVNPKSGKKSIPPKVCDIVRVFNDADYEVTLHVSKDIHDIYNTVVKGKEFDCIVCSGGDGSLNEMIDGCLEIGYEKPVGYIPAGTINDFARTMKLPMDPVICANKIVSEKYALCDVGCLNEKHFIYVAAFGALTDVSYNTPQEFKNILGHSAYILEGLKQLFDLKRYSMKINMEGQVIEDTFCLGIVGNTVSISGRTIFKNNEVDTRDGLFECILVRYPSTILEYQQIVHAFLTSDLTSCSNIMVYKVKEVTFVSTEEVAWTVDGEYGGNYSKVDINNIHNAIKILK